MSPIDINLASRSDSNEARGHDMHASLSVDGNVIAFIPDTISGRKMMRKLAASVELAAACRESLRWLQDHQNQCRSLGAAAAYLKAKAILSAIGEFPGQEAK